MRSWGAPGKNGKSKRKGAIEMSEQRIGKQAVESFKQYLILEEKSRATIDKYIHDINKFLDYLKVKQQYAAVQHDQRYNQ